MQILQNRSARSDLPMSNAARKQLALDPEKIRSKYKKEHLPLLDLHLGQDDMFQGSTSKQQFPATISSLCSEPRITRLLQKRVSHTEKLKSI